MASKLKLSKQEIARFQKDLKDCQAIREDWERATRAGVPHLDIVEKRLAYLEQRVSDLIAILGEQA